MSHTKINPQYRALKRMFDRVAAPHGSVATDYDAGNLNTMTADQFVAKQYEWFFREFASWFNYQFNKVWFK